MSDDNIEKKSLDGKRKGINKNFAILTLIVVIVALLGIILGSMFIRLERPDPTTFDFEKERLDRENLVFFLKLKTAITFVNMTISMMLILIYTRLYKETKSEFTMGLIVVMASFFVYALMSCPLIPYLLGMRPFGTGIFAMIPDMFATVALFTLLYISQK